MSEDTQQLDPPDPNYELKQRLHRTRLERQRIADEREARAEAAELSDQIEAEETALAAERAIASAEEQHGPLGKRILAVHCAAGVVIVKRPPAALFRRYQDVGKTTSDEIEKLVRPCLVTPDKATFDRWVEDVEPALLIRTGNAVCKLAGIRGEEVQGK